MPILLDATGGGYTLHCLNGHREPDGGQTMYNAAEVTMSPQLSLTYYSCSVCGYTEVYTPKGDE